MSRPIRKQTKRDFDARVRRIDPYYAATGTARPADRVGGSRLHWTVLGFFWITVAVLVSRRRDELNASLAAGSLPPHLQDAVMAGLAVMLGLTSLIIALHILRAMVRRSPGVCTSRPILAGGLAALMITHAPEGMVQSGVSQITPLSQKIVRNATETATSIRFDLGALVDVIPG